MSGAWVEPRQYYAIASSSPEVAVRVGALARERIAGLQGITAEQPKALATLFGPRWDLASGELNRFLARNQISHDWVTPESADLASLWPGDPPADADCPVLRPVDGTLISKPTAREVAAPMRVRRAVRVHRRRCGHGVAAAGDITRCARLRADG
jgi:thioredoxin reductase (NADPH)